MNIRIQNDGEEGIELKIIHELQDLRYLEWTQTRRSSGTAGSFLKAYEKKGRTKLYYKLSNYNSSEGIIGHECVNEIVIDRLLTKLNIEHLDYTLIHAMVTVRGVDYETYLCCSEDFKKKGDKKIALDIFYDMEAWPKENPMEFCLRYGFATCIYDMLLIDYLIMNRDRHGANIEVLKNSLDHSIRLAPLFDHGLSLIFQCSFETQYNTIDPMDEKRVQCFVGSSSTLENLQLIPTDKRRNLPQFDEALRHELFEGIEEIMGKRWIDAVWEFLTVRRNQYEDICHSGS